MNVLYVRIWRQTSVLLRTSRTTIQPLQPSIRSNPTPTNKQTISLPIFETPRVSGPNLHFPTFDPVEAFGKVDRVREDDLLSVLEGILPRGIVGDTRFASGESSEVSDGECL